MDKVEKTIHDLKNANLYSILELEKTDDHNQIKKAYKKLIKKYHPDKNKEANTVEKFDRIKIAYELLKNEELKALYDSKLKTKEERKIKKKQMNDKRRKFAEDLEFREKKNYDENHKNSHADNYQNENIFKEKNKYKEYKDELEKMFDNISHNLDNQIPKKKTIDEKLNKYGIKIKWKNDLGVIYTKDILKCYFREFGQIEEIILIENEKKALLLFTNEKAIRNILDFSDNIIHRLFKIKKYSKKEFNNEKEKNKFDLKNKFLDTNTLDIIRNKQFMTNLNFMQNEMDKPTTKHQKSNSFDINNKSKEDSKDLNIEKQSEKEINKTENINFDLDLDSMEKLLFERINKMK